MFCFGDEWFLVGIPRLAEQGVECRLQEITSLQNKTLRVFWSGKVHLLSPTLNHKLNKIYFGFIHTKWQQMKVSTFCLHLFYLYNTCVWLAEISKKCYSLLKKCYSPLKKCYSPLRLLFTYDFYREWGITIYKK